ncbi:MAG: hypothetical protein KC731_37565, partial [Myxococcales bacterium]|nr:hypothetical protein [Myxococcales bacterium]
IAAAKAEIAEMKTLLAYVKVEVTPSVEGVTLIVDDQEREGFASGQELVLPPGTRVFRARAKGYAEAEARAQVVSGHGNEAVQLNLKPTHGEVIITARHTDAWIEVDGQNRGKGLFQDMLTPGVHQIRVLRGKQIDSVQIVVQAGSRYTVTQDEDGELESDATAPLQEPEEEPSILPSFLRGFYGQGSAAFLAAFPHIDDLEVGTADRFGGAGGLHLGYRVTTWAAFEVFGQYSDIRASGDPGPKLQASLDATTNEITMVLKSVRAGGLLRVMLPGKSWIRFVGTVGGGVTIEWLEWRGESLDTTLFLDDKGVGPFGQLDLGVEFEFQGVLIDVVMQNILQTTKHFDLKNDRNAFDTQPIPIIGPAIRGGYALW